MMNKKQHTFLFAVIRDCKDSILEKFKEIKREIIDIRDTMKTVRDLKQKKRGEKVLK